MDCHAFWLKKIDKNHWEKNWIINEIFNPPQFLTFRHTHTKKILLKKSPNVDLAFNPKDKNHSSLDYKKDVFLDKWAF